MHQAGTLSRFRGNVHTSMFICKLWREAFVPIRSDWNWEMNIDQIPIFKSPHTRSNHSPLPRILCLCPIRRHCPLLSLSQDTSNACSQAGAPRAGERARREELEDCCHSCHKSAKSVDAGRPSCRDCPTTHRHM